MRKRTSIPILLAAAALSSCLPHGCSGRDATEYDLDEASFKADTLAGIEKESGIHLPAGARGLRYHYVPPIDPIVFAKVEIPAAAEKALAAQLAALADQPDFPADFANDRCPWWPSSAAGAIVVRRAVRDGLYLDVRLTREGERVVLFLKYFTI